MQQLLDLKQQLRLLKKIGKVKHFPPIRGIFLFVLNHGHPMFNDDKIKRFFTTIEYVAGHPHKGSTWVFGLGLDGLWSGRNHYMEQWSNIKTCSDKADYERLIHWFRSKGWVFYTNTEIHQTMINGKPLPMHLRGRTLSWEVIQAPPIILARMTRNDEVLEAYEDQDGWAVSITKPDGKRRVHTVLHRKPGEVFIKEKEEWGWTLVPTV